MGLYAFDGTNDDNSQAATDAAGVAADTNIFRFYSAYTGNAPLAGANVKTEYVPGVGTRFGIAGRIIGGSLGAGWLPRIDDAHEALCEAYLAGDRIIDVIGFSRGAAIALDFVKKVYRDRFQSNGRFLVDQPGTRSFRLLVFSR